MSPDTREIARATAPLNGTPVGRWRLGALLNPGPNRAADDRPMLTAHPAPVGVEGHWAGDGGGWWNPFDEEAAR